MIADTLRVPWSLYATVTSTGLVEKEAFMRESELAADA
jgi:hypothetical protein